MDFSTRGNQQSPAAPRPGTAFNEAPAPRKPEGKMGKRLPRGKWVKYGGLVLLTALSVLVLGVIGLMITSGSNAESKFVDKSKLQAVFLTNDQVYFGKITELNNKYIALSNIYYLQTQGAADQAAAAANNNVSLVKLGCELHKPLDRMIINRAEVQFWENLQADGQVANAVKQFVEQNPNGQTCSTTGNNATPGTNVQGSTQTPATTTPATNEDN